MNAEQIAAATQALVTATQQAAVQSGQQVETNQGQLAPGLNTGSNEQGGYNYARNIAPVVDPLTTSLVVNAKQNVLRGALKDATNSANNAYVDAQSAYQARERAFRVKQAEMSRERQRQQDAAAAAAMALSQSGGGAGVGDVSVKASGQYIGNNDWRGHLAYLAKNGDNNAKIALQYVGNDNKFALAPTDPRYKSAIGALQAVGATNVYSPPKAAPAPAQKFNTGVNAFNVPFNIPRG